MQCSNNEYIAKFHVWQWKGCTKPQNSIGENERVRPQKFMCAMCTHRTLFKSTIAIDRLERSKRSVFFKKLYSLTWPFPYELVKDFNAAKEYLIGDKSKMANSANEIEKQLVNEAVENEIQRIRFNWKIRETNYVENMLEEESNYNENLRRDLQRRDTISDIKINPDDDFLQQRQKERAEAFRHFRVSKRIKKAKLKYRLQYVTNKLLESTDMLESVHDLIGEAEQKLISQGFSKDKIETLRKRFDIDEGAEIINNIKESIISKVEYAAGFWFNELRFSEIMLNF
uniref:Uncharacterized protein n=1 Tax=Glossina pallidipes TaxID=7398 RepID=A0A1A9ZK64_GLOPL